jgi:integrase
MASIAKRDDARAQPRSQRAGVEDRWRKRDGSPSALDGRVTRWRARYVDDAGNEHARHFDRKVDAQNWIASVTASLVRGDHVDPKLAKMSVGAWCDVWIEGYRTRRRSTVRQAETHLKLIKEAFAAMPLSTVRPSHVKAWTAQLKAEGRADSYVYALHARLSQVMSDAVHDGVIARNPCSRRTSPGTGAQRLYVATTEQVWGLYDAVPEGIRPAILLGAFVGLRLAEAAALTSEHVDFMRGTVTPAVQWPNDPLKSETSRTPVPIPGELALMLSAAVAAADSTALVTNELGRPAGPWVIERAVRAARDTVRGLPAGFRFHDLRHYFASLLIADGVDVKTVQARLRHASAKTTLDVYGHLWPDKDESTRATVAAAITARIESPAESLRNPCGIDLENQTPKRLKAPESGAFSVRIDQTS